LLPGSLGMTRFVLTWLEPLWNSMIGTSDYIVTFMTLNR
jgi:hypothetical protein